MTMIVRFHIPGAIKAKARHRTAVLAGHPVAYPDKDSVTYESIVAMCALEAGVRKTYTGPVKLSAVFRFQIPKSRRRQLREADPHIQRPDLDNLEKSILDGCNHVAWYDDCQVSELTVRKCWTRGEPGVDVEIEYTEMKKPATIPAAAASGAPTGGKH